MTATGKSAMVPGLPSSPDCSTCRPGRKGCGSSSARNARTRRATAVHRLRRAPVQRRDRPPANTCTSLTGNPRSLRSRKENPRPVGIPPTRRDRRAASHGRSPKQRPHRHRRPAMQDHETSGPVAGQHATITRSTRQFSASRYAHTSIAVGLNPPVGRHRIRSRVRRFPGGIFLGFLDDQNRPRRSGLPHPQAGRRRPLQGRSEPCPGPALALLRQQARTAEYRKTVRRQLLWSV
jgi:hypothetical protein